MICNIPEFTGIQPFFLGFEVSTVVTMKNAILWDVTPCGCRRTERVYNKQTPWPLVHKRTIPTERTPIVDEI
jgi:hypothetical protein